MSDCNECRGKGEMYGAKCGFCRGTGKTQRGRSIRKEKHLSHYTCICGAEKEGLLSHGIDCPMSREGRSRYDKADFQKDAEDIGFGCSWKTKKGYSE